MKIVMTKKRSLILIIFLILALFGCESLNTKNIDRYSNQKTETIENQEIIEIAPTEPSPIPSNTPYIKPSQTKKPFIYTYPTPSPTWTAAPTLSRENAQNLIEDLLENNGGCKLPC